MNLCLCCNDINVKLDVWIIDYTHFVSRSSFVDSCFFSCFENLCQLSFTSVDAPFSASLFWTCRAQERKNMRWHFDLFVCAHACMVVLQHLPATCQIHLTPSTNESPKFKVQELAVTQFMIDSATAGSLTSTEEPFVASFSCTSCFLWAPANKRGQDLC